MKYGDGVCVAGVRLDTATPQWVRLFPVAFRDLPEEQQFEKYDVITLRAQKHSTDRRAESYRPDLGSIRVGQHLAPGGHWPARRRWVEPLLGPTMCELHRGRKGGGDGPSLGVVRPGRVIDVVARDAEPWTAGQRSTLGPSEPAQHQGRPGEAGALVRLPMGVRGPGCKSHTQGIADWELGQAYRGWGRKGYDVIESVRKRWLQEMCGERRDTMFFVGDQHRYPGQFMVLGTF